MYMCGVLLSNKRSLYAADQDGIIPKGCKTISEEEKIAHDLKYEARHPAYLNVSSLIAR